MVLSPKINIPEVINSPSIGSLFEIDDNESVSVLNLYRALKSTLELEGKPDTEKLCRQHASQYDWKKVVKQMISLYERVVSGNS